MSDFDENVEATENDVIHISSVNLPFHAPENEYEEKLTRKMKTKRMLFWGAFVLIMDSFFIFGFIVNKVEDFESVSGLFLITLLIAIFVTYKFLETIFTKCKICQGTIVEFCDVRSGGGKYESTRSTYTYKVQVTEGSQTYEAKILIDADLPNGMPVNIVRIGRRSVESFGV